MIIRQEIPKDFNNIYNLVKTAFETAEVKDGDEQNFVNKLRRSKNYIPELALVAENINLIIGHIMFTKLDVTYGENIYTELLVAPLCVALEYRNKGIGKKLMEYGFKEARRLGYSAAFLCGNPEYYKKFGFKPTSYFGIENKSNIPDKFVMSCELFSDALKNKKGSVNIIS